MSGTTTVVIVVLVVLAVIALAVVLGSTLRGRHSQGLRSRFGPEYERVVKETGSRQQAEQVLQDRVRRRNELHVRDLEPEARDRYAGSWRQVQAQFVDDPARALRAADDLVGNLMRDRGYPAADFEQGVADVSVDHSSAIPGYRRAHEVSVAADRDGVGTDDMRDAMVSYRRLFEELLGEPVRVEEATADEYRAGTVGDRSGQEVS